MNIAFAASGPSTPTLRDARPRARHLLVVALAVLTALGALAMHGLGSAPSHPVTDAHAPSAHIADPHAGVTASAASTWNVQEHEAAPLVAASLAGAPAGMWCAAGGVDASGHPGTLCAATLSVSIVVALPAVVVGAGIAVASGLTPLLERVVADPLPPSLLFLAVDRR